MSELNVLSPRLSAIADLAGRGRVLADIGTDHALLPIHMIGKESFSRAFACDVNDGPLQRAYDAVKKHNMEKKISLFRSDGLHSVPEEYDVLVIAGMGGDLISRILSEHPPACAERLILQPMTKAETLRKFLFNNGYSISQERAVTEGAKCYIIFSVRKVPMGKVSEIDYYLPHNLDRNLHAPDYLKKLLSSHRKRLSGLFRAEVFDENAVAFEEKLTEALENQLKNYEQEALE